MTGSGGGRRATQQEALIGHTLQRGEYIIEAVLGHGGMGQVFLASHVQADVPVAIKQVRADEPLPPSVIEELDALLRSKTPPARSPRGDFPLSGGANTDRFLREALLLARLRHLAIPLFYDYFLEHGSWYLVMEYVPGSTLSSYVREHAPLPPLEAINYALQICDVLNYLHRQTPPVVFRDLKPANIILHPDGRLMIVDFGIARYFKEGQFNDTTDFGSPGYASPEQYEGTGQTDARSDLFSLGVIIHEMLSGQRPTRRGANTEHLESLHKLNQAISPALSGLVMVATRAEPMYRFQSAHTFYQALERVRSVEERRAYRYHTLMAEVTAAQKTPVFPLLIPPPSSQGFLSSELAREQDERAQHMRMRDQAQRSVSRDGLAQEALAHQLTAIDESLKLRAVSSPLTYAAAHSAAFPPPHVSDRELAMIEAPTIPTPAPGPIPTPGSLLSQPTAPPRKKTWLILLLCLVLLVLAGSLLGYYYFKTRPAPAGAPTVSGHTSRSASQATVAGWQSLPSLPTEAADNTAVYSEDAGEAAIYMSGGYRGAHLTPMYSRGLYRYSIATARWEKVDLPAFPAMGNNAAAEQGGEIFFSGGYAPGTGTVSATISTYRPASHTLSALPASPRLPLGFGGSMLADQRGHLYLTEGFLTPGAPSIQAGTGWYRYDIATGSWHNLARLPVGAGYVLLAQYTGGDILLLGGARDAGQRQPLTRIYRYDVRQNAWRLVAQRAPAQLSGAASCADGHGNLVIVGGYDAALHLSRDTVWLLHVQTLRWRPLPPLPNGGSVLGTASCDRHGHVYVTRGANNPVKPTRDFLELTLPPG